MSMLVRKNWIHIVIWAGMLLYLVFARELHVRFFVQNGKPVVVNAELPPERKEIEAYIDRLDFTVYNGQYLYSLVGWAFSAVDPAMRPDDFERQIVLISKERNYFFSTEANSRPDVQEHFKSLGMGLINSGFSAFFSKDAIVPGTYQVGVVFHSRTEDSTYYASTDKYLIRTPNQLRISNQPSIQSYCCKTD